jgi:putative ABC transport system permease protein
MVRTSGPPLVTRANCGHRCHVESVMTALLLDIRYTLRLWSKQQTFTVAAVATIAMAIAAHTAIFSIVHAVLLKPLDLPDPSRVVRIEEQHQGRRLNLTGATFVDLRERIRQLGAVAEYRIRSVGLYAEGTPEQLTAADVSADYFTVLGVQPRRGRWFRSEDFGAGTEATVIISDGLWRRSFGGNEAVGHVVVIDAVPVRIVGVAPAGLFAPGNPDVWLPEDASSTLRRNRRAHLFTTIGRLTTTASLESMQTELATVAQGTERDSGGVDGAITLLAKPLQARMVEPVRPALIMLWSAVGLVLLIAAANVANLLLMQGVSRTREWSIRAALGASRSRIGRQIVTECVLLACGGGFLGTILGWWSLPAVRAALPSSIPRVADLSPDLPTLLFGILLSAVMAALVGFAPAMRGSMRHPMEVLRGRTHAAGARSLARSLLVVAEVALTVMLLSGAALLARSLWMILQVQPGYNTSGVVTFRLSLPSATYPDASAHNAFYSRVLERIAALPGVAAAGVTGALPLTGTPATTMEPEQGPASEQFSADVLTASPGFFAALQIPLRQGRLFGPADAKGAQPVAIINQAAARRFWPDVTSPLGQHLTMKDWGEPYRAEVVGIVQDVHQAGADADVTPAVYYPLAQFPETTLSEAIVVRTIGDLQQTISAVRSQVSDVDPRQPIALVRTMDDIAAASIAERRFNLSVIGLFALGGVFLSALGIYGIVAFAVAERAQEFGVRIALGARRSDLVRLVAMHGARPVAVGLLVGLAGAVFASRLLVTLLFSVRPTDALTLIAVTITIVVVTVLACAGPVRRAMRVDPIVAIRAE